MLENLRLILEEKCKLVSDCLIIVGVSGGPDSLCLLDILWRLEYPLIVAHLDHSLRPDSVFEVDAVRQMAERRGLPFVLGVEDVAGLARSRSLSVEEAGRIARYQFLFAQAEKYQAQVVAVGHTADDQVETVLMHLLRGSGLAGLRGMAYRAVPNLWSDDIPLVRPLLAMWRDEISAYLAEHELNPVLDPSNQDQTYYRNRLRHELLPFLTSYNPAVHQLLWRTADLLQGDYQILEQMIQSSWERCLLEQGTGFLGFNRRLFLEQPLGVQRHLIRMGIAELRTGIRDIDYETIERALAFSGAPPRTNQCDLVAGLILEVEGDKLWLYDRDTELPCDEWPQLPAGESFGLAVPGKLALNHGWELQVKLVKAPVEIEPSVRALAGPNVAWLDAERLRGSLEVRPRLPGDRFQPLGMEGKSMKLADLMVNEKIPRRARERWPLICLDGEILWVPGIKAGHPARVTTWTQQILQLRLIQGEPV